MSASARTAAVSLCIIIPVKMNEPDSTSKKQAESGFPFYPRELSEKQQVNLRMDGL